VNRKHEDVNDAIFKKREQKAYYKAAQIIATATRRKNRDEDMNNFAIYYKKFGCNATLKQLKTRIQ
jgi:hypothetical protein